MGDLTRGNGFPPQGDTATEGWLGVIHDPQGLH